MYDRPGERDMFVVMKMSNSNSNRDNTAQRTEHDKIRTLEYWITYVNEQTVRLFQNVRGYHLMYAGCFCKGHFTADALLMMQMDIGDAFLGQPTSHHC